jgi:hypothetical protein
MVTAGALTDLAGPRWTYVLASALLGLASTTAFVLFRVRADFVEPARSSL